MFQWRDHCEKKMKKYKYLTAHRATEQSEREDIKFIKNNISIKNKTKIYSTHNYTKLTTSTMMKVMKK